MFYWRQGENSVEIFGLMFLVLLCVEWNISPGHRQASGLHLCHWRAEARYRGVCLRGEQLIMHCSHGYTNTQRGGLDTAWFKTFNTNNSLVSIRSGSAASPVLLSFLLIPSSVLWPPPALHRSPQRSIGWVFRRQWMRYWMSQRMKVL